MEGKEDMQAAAVYISRLCNSLLFTLFLKLYCSQRHGHDGFRACYRRVLALLLPQSAYSYKISTTCALQL